MKRFTSALTVLLLVACVTPAFAQEAPTPTPGGLLIPTATPSGLLIPTSTPAGPSLPALTLDQIKALNLQPGDMPAGFDWVQSANTLDVLGAIQVARDEGRTAEADRLQAISDAYGWRTNDGFSYYIWNKCPATIPSIPIIDLNSMVSQLAGPEQARAFIDDEQVRQLFTEQVRAYPCDRLSRLEKHPDSCSILFPKGDGP